MTPLEQVLAQATPHEAAVFEMLWERKRLLEAQQAAAEDARREAQTARPTVVLTAEAARARTLAQYGPNGVSY